MGGESGAMNMKLSVILAVLAGLSVEVGAQSRPASDSEIETIREAFEVDDIPEWKHHVVLEVQGTYTARTDTSGEYLTGEIYFQPYSVQSSLCVMEAWFRTGHGRNGQYEWGAERYGYWNWLHVEGRSCEISDRSELPEDAVVTNEPIPSASLIYILSNASELLSLYFVHVAGESAISSSQKEQLLNYSNDPNFRLNQVGITAESTPEIGFAYTAMYRSPNFSEGPIVTFSISEFGFRIHAAGFWIS